MLFFRVCHLNEMHWQGNYHCGPYGGDHSDMISHVLPYEPPEFTRDCEFTEPDRYEEFVCGFVSLEMLAEWFGRCVRELDEVGFVIRAFEVPESAIRTGTYQAACLWAALPANAPVVGWDALPDVCQPVVEDEYYLGSVAVDEPVSELVAA